jgi:hypothetical protein
LIAAADLIGAAWAIRGPRHDAVTARKEGLDRAILNARIKLVAMIRMGVTIEELTKPPVVAPTLEDQLEETIELDKERPLVSRVVNYAGRKVRQVGIKSLYGGMNQPPPSKSIPESIFSGVGTFLTMLIVTQFGKYVSQFVTAGRHHRNWLVAHPVSDTRYSYVIQIFQEWGADYSLVVGPFGALATLHYALTAAPASQPRNAMLGQLVALTFGVAISKSELEPWMKMSLAPAATVLVTTKLGIIHPPAGATAGTS